MTTNKPQVKYQVLFIGDSVSDPRVIGEACKKIRMGRTLPRNLLDKAIL